MEMNSLFIDSCRVLLNSKNYINDNFKYILNHPYETIFFCFLYYLTLYNIYSFRSYPYLDLELEAKTMLRLRLFPDIGYEYNIEQNI